MQLISREPRKYHVSHDLVREFESAIIKDSRVTIPVVRRLIDYPAMAAMGRWIRASDKPDRVTYPKLPAGLIPKPTEQYFAVCMGSTFVKCMPQFLYRAHKSIYLFDAWPSQYKNILKFAQQCELEHIFVSASQSAHNLAEKCSTTNFHWVPEGICTDEYVSMALDKKDIDVIQFGRRFDEYHEIFRSVLSANKKSYHHGPLGTRLQFMDTLARSKISVCFPSNMTHPDRAGDIETMTVRYLQSMVSKCLILGHAPKEMVELFGYNPVIEIDPNQPGEQILNILDNMSEYQGLIERNFETVLNHHSWQHRWGVIANVLFT